MIIAYIIAYIKFLSIPQNTSLYNQSTIHWLLQLCWHLIRHFSQKNMTKIQPIEYNNIVVWKISCLCSHHTDTLWSKCVISVCKLSTNVLLGPKRYELCPKCPRTSLLLARVNCIVPAAYHQNAVLLSTLTFNLYLIDLSPISLQCLLEEYCLFERFWLSAAVDRNFVIGQRHLSDSVTKIWLVRRRKWEFTPYFLKIYTYGIK